MVGKYFPHSRNRRGFVLDSLSIIPNNSLSDTTLSDPNESETMRTETETITPYKVYTSVNSVRYGMVGTVRTMSEARILASDPYSKTYWIANNEGQIVESGRCIDITI